MQIETVDNFSCEKCGDNVERCPEWRELNDSEWFSFCAGHITAAEKDIVEVEEGTRVFVRVSDLQE